MSDVQHILQEGRKRLDALEASARASAGPCSRCEFGRKIMYTDYCQHPATRDGHFNPTTGKVVWTDKRQDSARRSGECGPTGQLFMPASPLLRARRWLGANRWIFLIVLMAAEVVLLPLMLR